MACIYILIIDSCLALNLNYSGCCVFSLSATCSNNGCYCDKSCHIFRDCCNDIADIGCHPTTPPTDTPGKIKSETYVIHLS